MILRLLILTLLTFANGKFINSNNILRRLNEKYPGKLDLPPDIDGRRLQDNTELNEFIVTLKNNRVSITNNHDYNFSSIIHELELGNQDPNLPYFESKVNNVYKKAIPGFSGYFSEEAMEYILQQETVNSIELDKKAYINIKQTDPIWNLDRIDQINPQLNNLYDTGSINGRGVNVFILDTGLNINHQEFNGRIGICKDFVKDGNGCKDCNGHGTHCAGTVGGTKWGVAKEVTINSLRVLNCQGSGSYSSIIAAIDWMILNTDKNSKNVGSLSLGGSRSNTLNLAVNNAVKDNIIMVVAAGNENTNACQSSPASAELAITVASIQQGDRRSSFSNYGECVNIFAPGSFIKSADYLSNTGSSILSGTSMACPHVAGAVALEYTKNPNLNKAELITELLYNSATQGAVIDPKSVNLLLRTPNGKKIPIPTPSPKPNPLPTPSITPPNQCRTEGGGNSNRKCLFPFIFREKIYRGCTNDYDPNGRLWCSTLVDENGNHISGQGEWGYCSNNCPIDDPDVCKTEDNIKCVFPFNFEGSTYNKCALWEETNKYWCSTLVDSNNNHIKGNWGNCASNCPIDDKPTLSPTRRIPTNLPTVLPTTSICRGRKYPELDEYCKNKCPQCDLELCDCSSPKTRYPTPKITLPLPTPQPSENCQTIESPLGIKPCIFPCRYKGYTYNGCTTINSRQPWCCTEVTDNNEFIQGKFGFCNSNCPIDKSKCNWWEWWCTENIVSQDLNTKSSSVKYPDSITNLFLAIGIIIVIIFIAFIVFVIIYLYNWNKKSNISSNEQGNEENI